MKIALVEPPKDFWFVMGKYMPPPFGLLCLAAYLEHARTGDEITVIDCQAEGLDWDGLEKLLSELEPDVVASSGMATANAYYGLRVCQITKQLNPHTKTVLGGTHYTALADETLTNYPEVDYIVIGEGEETFAELVTCIEKDDDYSTVLGLSYRGNRNPDRPLICDLDQLPPPAYHLVAEHMDGYYFSLMAEEDKPFAIVEGSRGCRHNCSYCSQWRFWNQTHRFKSTHRIVDEFEQLYTEYGSRFFWFTDDNFGLHKHTEEVCDGLIERGLGDEIEWFCQLRVDDIVSNPDIVVKLREAGAIWALVGFDNLSEDILKSYRKKGVAKTDSKRAVELLRENQIFSQGTFIIGHPSDSHESIEALRNYADYLDPDIATFFALTPFPGTEIYEDALERGWIEDTNWAHYDMVHATMPTKHLTREEVQKELWNCYNSFFTNLPRLYKGITSDNPVTQRTYGYLARQNILANLKDIFR
ncbi:B12-binding domain-containing radical SAM protein [archaeon]|nr:B12-binding domain-containing radical SAM protein [archaeon]